MSFELAFFCRIPRALRLLAILQIAFVAFTLQACAPARPAVPVGTIPPARDVSPEEEQHGHKVLSELTKKYELDYTHPRYQNVLDVVQELTTAINAQSKPWHVYVLKDDALKNAAATRGHHIFIWTAMIDETQNDDELAAILGHEIGHVLARHTDPDPNETMRTALVEIGSMIAGVAVAVATENPNLARNAGRLTTDLSREVGNALVRYPYSRERELEADHIGLFLMDRAGYQPEAALHFWERALHDPSFSSQLSFFSTHPPAADRLERLRQILPLLKQARPQAVQENTNNSLLLAERKANQQPLASGDSFDISTPAVAMQEQPATQYPEFVEWQVIGTRAILYQQASARSRPLGEFKEDAFVLGIAIDDTWVRIESPEAGYLLKQSLRRTVNDGKQ